MKLWSSVQSNDLKGINAICFDIDDTFSSDGKITAEAYQSLWNLRNKGWILVPITGRPAGWCDHIARFWPVDAVIGENGAFLMSMQNHRLVTQFAPQVPVDVSSRLQQLKKNILAHDPGATFASDQDYRKCDLAIDFAEDVGVGGRWSDSRIQSMLEFCRSQGAVAKLSSIHINTWFGDYDKCSGFEFLLASGVVSQAQRWIYTGDSPNDEPLFEHFQKLGHLTVGVANIRDYQQSIRTLPEWITDSKSGEGFCEIADRLVSVF